MSPAFYQVPNAFDRGANRGRIWAGKNRKISRLGGDASSLSRLGILSLHGRCPSYIRKSPELRKMPREMLALKAQK